MNSAVPSQATSSNLSDDFLDLSRTKLLVTGATGALGMATAILASRFGASCVLWGRNRKSLDQTLNCLSGSNHHAMEIDLSKLDTIEPGLDRTSEMANGLDGIAHFAGVHATVPVRSLDLDETEELIRVNLTSAFALVKAFRRKSIPKDSPSVVLVGSVAGLKGESGASAYSASKGAIISLTRSLAVELAKDGIRVNCVSPGAVDAGMTKLATQRSVGVFDGKIAGSHPLGLGTPEDVASAVLFLLSSRSKWATGANFVIDGGYTA